MRLTWIAMDRHSLCITSKQGKKQRRAWERVCSSVGTSLGHWTDEVSVPAKLQASSLRRDQIYPDEYG